MQSGNTSPIQFSKIIPPDLIKMILSYVAPRDLDVWSETKVQNPDSEERQLQSFAAQCVEQSWRELYQDYLQKTRQAVDESKVPASAKKAYASLFSKPNIVEIMIPYPYGRASYTAKLFQYINERCGRGLSWLDRIFYVSQISNAAFKQEYVDYVLKYYDLLYTHADYLNFYKNAGIDDPNYQVSKSRLNGVKYQLTWCSFAYDSDYLKMTLLVMTALARRDEECEFLANNVVSLQELKECAEKLKIVAKNNSSIKFEEHGYESHELIYAKNKLIKIYREKTKTDYTQEELKDFLDVAEVQWNSCNTLEDCNQLYQRYITVFNCNKPVSGKSSNTSTAILSALGLTSTPMRAAFITLVQEKMLVTKDTRWSHLQELAYYETLLSHEVFAPKNQANVDPAIRNYLIKRVGQTNNNNNTQPTTDTDTPDEQKSLISTPTQNNPSPRSGPGRM